MHENSNSELFRTTFGILVSDALEESTSIMNQHPLTILGVTGLSCSFGLDLKRKAGMKIIESTK